MRIERSIKEYGSGGGITIFESKMFNVILWRLSNGVRTTISCELLPCEEINFDGEQKFDSDSKCMEQYTFIEILRMIECQKEISFKEGIEHKLTEIKKCLYIR